MVTKLPEISVIIPVYKTEKYLHKCLDSIIAQTYTNWEAIIVDDGSPDNCGNICDEYATKDNRFKVIHQKNGGVVKARNKGIKIASGTYLAFVDSDDYIEPTMLEEMLLLANKQSLDIVWCDAMGVFKNNQRQCNIKIHNNPIETLRDTINGKIPGWLCIKLINRDFWKRCNILTDESAVIFEDTYISIQLLSNNPRIGMIDKAFYNYVRTNEDAATYKIKIAKAERNIKNIYDYLKSKDLYEICKKEFTNMALTFKIALLREDIDKAYEVFPFSHKNIRNFKFRFCTSLFYWFCFNVPSLGKRLLKIHLKQMQ